ncbi:hypothetical protein [Humisphaera borealis]|uniref:Uncharacterized protein n=1 Tax=Humisphaera borealis TaxID=2807512 RepID=A0A7M2WZP7_9BACT|nr:hypothetical protein [Humisphaera borealis]QOV90956.1 hypothetical protein IPV69_06235 [Humisphaera borealis]
MSEENVQPPSEAFGRFNATSGGALSRLWRRYVNGLSTRDELDEGLASNADGDIDADLRSLVSELEDQRDYVDSIEPDLRRELMARLDAEVAAGTDVALPNEPSVDDPLADPADDIALLDLEQELTAEFWRRFNGLYPGLAPELIDPDLPQLKISGDWESGTDKSIPTRHLMAAGDEAVSGGSDDES